MEININLRVISQLNEGDKLLVSSNLLQIDRSNRGVINAVSRYLVMNLDNIQLYV